MSWLPRDYQYTKAQLANTIMRKYGLVYLAMQERAGKTMTALVTCEMMKCSAVLVITKRKAMEGWTEALFEYDTISIDRVDTVTYQQAYKYMDNTYDCIILDEAHNYISAFPGRRHNKVTKLYSQIKAICTDQPIIYISATPHAQGYQQIFNQFALSYATPFKQKNPYDWFDEYGVPDPNWVNGREVESYKKTQENRVRQAINHLFVRGTRKELGFTYEPKDVIHYIELGSKTKEFYNHLLKKKVVNVQGISQVADSSPRLRSLLHMLEGGTLKLTGVDATVYNPDTFNLPHQVVRRKELVDILVDTPFNEKVDFIKAKWGDTEDLVIFYNYIAEKFMLERAFKNALVVQATSHAEGVDYAHIKHMVIYSQDFSTARHTQRRARQSGKSRTSEIDIHYLLVEKGVSEQVYDAVSVNKVNFVDSVFTRDYL